MAAAIAAVWLPCLPGLPRALPPPWAFLFCAALLVAASVGIVLPVAWVGIGSLLALIGGTEIAKRTDCFRLARFLSAAVILILFAFGVQQIPGFVGTTVVAPVRISPDAVPMRLVARFDVELAALFLLALYGRRVTNLAKLRAIVLPTAVAAGVTTASAMGMAVAAGYIRFDPKWPPFALMHLGKTLLVTAVLEEVFFRGILQARLARLAVFHRTRLGRAIPIVFSAALFGAAHLPAGWLMVALATLAGLGYALSYALTERIEAPILVHFAVNATHFITFTYPNLAVTP